jgi:hypothetical protein
LRSEYTNAYYSQPFDAAEGNKFAAQFQPRMAGRHYRPSQDNHPSSAAATALVRAAIFQLICKPLYLFFPRDVDDSFGVVEKTFAQQI